MPKFHYKDNWYFERLEDGSVMITHPDGPGLNSEPEEFIIDADSWASIVAHVSSRGEKADTFREASLFHAGKEVQVIDSEGVGRVEDIL